MLLVEKTDGNADSACHGFFPHKNAPIENLLIAFSNQLAKEDIHCNFIFSKQPADWFHSAITEHASYSVIPWPSSPFNCDKVARAAWRIKPQLITYWYVPLFSVCCQVTARLPFIKKSIFFDRDSFSPPPKPTFKKLLVRLRSCAYLPPIKQIVSVSHFNRNRNIKSFFVPPSKNIVIHNGVYLEQAAPPDIKTPYFFYAGQIERFKGVHTLARAFSIFLERHPDTEIELWLAGKGSADAEVRAEAEKSRRPEKFKLLGMRSDVPSLMAGSIANIVPSEWPEACASTALQALASGRVPIVSDAGSLPELIEDCGLIFPRGDSDKLADALGRAVSENWNSVTTRGTERAHKLFSFERMVDDYVNLFVNSVKP